MPVLAISLKNRVAVIALSGMMALIFIVALLPQAPAMAVIREGGIVESASAISWFLIAAILGIKKRFALSSLPLFCGMRELDLHKQWTTDSVLKSKYYLGDYVSNDEKILAAAVLIIFLTVMLSACAFYARRFYNAIRAGELPAINILISIALLLVSKLLLDGIGRKLLSVGIEVDIPFIFTIIEEVMELTAALLVLAVSVSWAKNTS